MKSLRQLFDQLRHTRPSQTVDRIRLLGKRHALATLARLAPVLTPRLDGRTPALAPIAPRPVFAPRTDTLGGIPGAAVARVPGLEVPLDPRPSWHPASASPLAHLALHYMEFLEAADDATFVRLIEDWIACNPPYSPRYWAHAWSAYAVSIRSVVWMQQIALRRATVSEPFIAEAAASIAGQLRFLVSNLETDIGGNHLLKNVKALLWASRFFAGDEADEWGALGARLLERELAEQILADGVHFERSPSYHAQVTADLVECRILLHADALRDRLDSTLHRMVQALSDLAHPDGYASLFNDGGFHAAYLPIEVIEAWRLVSGHPPPRPRAVFGFEAAGFYGARAGESFVIADCGALAPDHLPAHGHGDALAFEWSVAGARLIVDPGVYEYTAGAMRAYSRSTMAHNTVTVADADQAEFSGSFRMGRRAKVERMAWQPRSDGFILEGRHDGFAKLTGSPIHRRRFDGGASHLRIDDSVSGGAGQPVRARLLLHPDAVITRQEAAVVLVAHGAARMRIEASAAIAIEDAWFCPDFGVRLAAQRLVIEYGSAPVEGWIRLEVVG